MQFILTGQSFKMHKTITLKDRVVSPALFLAPMAGITNSAFRRLLSDFGGYGALFTEMLSGKGILYENMEESTYTKRRDKEGDVIYQLLLNDDDNYKAIIDKLKTISPFGLDLNLGCPAPMVRRVAAGSALFADISKMEKTLESIRKHWNGIFTVKVRLGEDPENWRDSFLHSLKIFEKYKIDAITVHPRFVKDRLKRKPRWEEFAWIRDNCDLPLIANGDIISPNQINEKFDSVDGLMLGRVVVAKPWIFKVFSGDIDENLIDYAEVWERMFNYIIEDFAPNKVLGRIKEFNGYYARNFFFGHKLYSQVQGSRDLDFIYDKAMAFLTSSPRVCKTISLAGV